jgi:hypothetical protein
MKYWQRKPAIKILLSASRIKSSGVEVTGKAQMDLPHDAISPS